MTCRCHAAAAAAVQRLSGGSGGARTLPAVCSGDISGPITMPGAWQEALWGHQQAAHPSAHLLTALLAVGLAVVASRLASKLMRRSGRSQAAPDTSTAAAAAAAACGSPGSEDEVTASAKLIAGVP